MLKIKSIEIKAIGKAIIFSIILSILVAILIYFTSLRENLLPILGKIIIAISIFWAATSISSYHGTKGLVRGISTGLTFFILMLIATVMFNKALITMGTFFYNLAICVVAGGLGGILGISLTDA